MLLTGGGPSSATEVFPLLTYNLAMQNFRLGEGAALPIMMLPIIGLLVLVAADLVLAMNDHWSVIPAGVALWGIHMGMTQGLLATMIADVAPADLRGTAFGSFNLACGLAMLIASLLAGFLWDRLGAAFTFYAGACFSVLAIIGTLSSPMTQHRRTG